MSEKKEGILSKIFKKMDEALKKKAEKASSSCACAEDTCRPPQEKDKGNDSETCCS